MSSVLTGAEAAEDLKVSEAIVWDYHRKGLLDVMRTRNIGACVSRRGPQDARIELTEWARFKAFLTVKVERPATEGEKQTPVHAKPRPGRPRGGPAAPAGSEKWLRAHALRSELGTYADRPFLASAAPRTRSTARASSNLA